MKLRYNISKKNNLLGWALQDLVMGLDVRWLLRKGYGVRGGG